MAEGQRWLEGLRAEAAAQRVPDELTHLRSHIAQLEGDLRQSHQFATEKISAETEESGVPGPTACNHISARAQEFVLSAGCRHDARMTIEMSSSTHTSHDANKLGRAG